ncbi:MAG: flippase [Dermatophilaceae bacterium]
MKGPDPVDADSLHLRSMARGGGLNLLGAASSQLSLLSITLLLAHTLGSREVGRYAECYAILSLLGLLSLCGFRAAMTRFVAIHLADDDPARLRGTIRLGLWLSLVSSAVLGALLAAFAVPISHLFHDPALVTGLRLTGLTLPAATFTDAALSATQGWRTQRPFTLIGRVYEPITRLVLTAVALLAGAEINGAFWALAIAAWSASLLAARALNVRLRTAPKAVPIYGVRAIFSFSMVSWVSTLASTGLIWADTLILAALTTDKDVGVYNVSTRLVMMAVFVMAPINAAFGPQIAHLYHTGNMPGLALSYKAATGWIVRLSLPAFVVLMVFPQDLLRLFGPEFQSAAAVTSVLAVGQLVNASTGPCGTLLSMSGKVAVNMVDNVGVLALNVVLNLWLIPSLGILGAAIAWSISLTLVNVLRVLQVRRYLGVLPFSSATVKGFVAAAATLVAAFAVRTFVGSASVRVVVGVSAALIVYAGMTALLRISTEDRALLGAVAGRGHQAA